MSDLDQPVDGLVVTPLFEFTLCILNAWAGAFGRAEALLDNVRKGTVKPVDIHLQLEVIRLALRNELETVADEFAPNGEDMKQFVRTMFK